jgi:hypothetical protein
MQVPRRVPAGDRIRLKSCLNQPDRRRRVPFRSFVTRSVARLAASARQGSPEARLALHFGFGFLPGRIAMTSPRPLVRNALLHLILAIPFCTLAGTALAQTPAPASAPLPASAAAACGAKPDYPGRLASDKQLRAWHKEANDYLGCYKKYVLGKQQAAQQAAQELLKAANEAVEEYNATAKELEQASKGE